MENGKKEGAKDVKKKPKGILDMYYLHLKQILQATMHLSHNLHTKLLPS